ncbi:MAG: hypothetical protein WBO56_00965 [Microgenomates group bacterium]|nr:MAG: hypothetical protein IPH70_04595 [Candidatus Roizmanbacteria bacterium]
MRKISLETDKLQIFWIAFFLVTYFLTVGLVKILTFIVLFVSTILFMLAVGISLKKKIKISSMLFTFSYGLLPTTIWFYMSLVLLYLLPPPRTQSLQGKVFSVLYVSFSLSLLLWKIILSYLAIRFSLKLGFYSTMIALIFYIGFIAILSYFGLTLGLSKVPFI